MDIVIKEEEVDLGVFDYGGSSQNFESTGAHYRPDNGVARNETVENSENLAATNANYAEGLILRGRAYSGELDVPGYSWTPTIVLSDEELSEENEDWCNISTDDDEDDGFNSVSQHGEVTFNISNLLHGEIPRQWNPRVVLDKVDSKVVESTDDKNIDVEDDGKKTGCHCEVCGKYLAYKRYYKIHMRLHTGEKPLVCKYCGKGFAYQAILASHILRLHGKRPHACPICKKGFTLGGNLKKHLKTHSADEQFQCHLCNEPFTQSPLLDEHMKVHFGESALFSQNPDKRYDCQHCSRSFLTSSLLKVHMKKHACCKECGMQFENRNALLTHTRTISCGKNCCELCGRGYSHFYNLKRHMRSHNNSAASVQHAPDEAWSNKNIDVETVSSIEHICLVCGENFNDKQALEIHSQVCNVSGSYATAESDSGSFEEKKIKRRKSYFCKICKKGFCYKLSMLSHLKKHKINERVLKASSAKQSSESEKNVLGEAKNSGEKKYLCKVCGKGFQFRQNLWHHAKIHNRSNSQISNLKKHVNVFKETPYRCGTCFKYYSGMANLNKHLKLHKRAGEEHEPKAFAYSKPSSDVSQEDEEDRIHSCRVCGIKFSCKSRLDRHEENHKTAVQSRNHVCEICDMGFYHKYNLLKHAKVHLDQEISSNEQLEAEIPNDAESMDSGNEEQIPDSLSCQSCGKKFSNSANLFRHSQLHMKVEPRSEAKRFVCKTCGKGYDRKNNFNVHVRKHANDRDNTTPGVYHKKPTASVVPPLRIKKPFVCRHCDKRFFTISLLRTHLKMHSKCGLCGWQCSSLVALKAHSKKHPGYLPFACRVCFKRFFCNETMSKHVRLHDKVEPSHKEYLCKVCGRGYDSFRAITKHAKIHLREKVQTSEAVPEEDSVGNNISSHSENVPVDEKRNDQITAENRPLSYYKFCCEKCDQRFATASMLIEHRRSHLKCGICDLQFRNLRLFSKHIRKHPNYRPFVCKFCHKGFGIANSLYSHMQLHQKVAPSGKDHVCHVCGRGYDSFRSLIKHSKIIHGAEVVRNAPETPENENSKVKAVETQSQAKGERLIIESGALPYNEVPNESGHGSNPFKCPICKKILANRGSALRHSLLHKKVEPSTEEPFHCKICGRGFALKRSLTRHSEVHKFENRSERSKPVKSTVSNYVPPLRIKKPFRCISCPKSFFTSSLLSIHKRTHFKCRECGKQLENKQCLERHMRIHSDKCSYSCQFCKKGFNAISDLCTHIRCTHRIPNPRAFVVEDQSGTKEDEKPFVCHTCNKSFKKEHHLRLHCKVHDEEEKINTPEDSVIESASTYNCEHCGKSYSYKMRYIAHLETHAKKQAFACSECEETFKNKLLLDSHLKVHKRDKPYCCQTCGERFLAFASLKIHKLIHSQVEQDSEGSNMDKQDAFPTEDIVVDVDVKPFVCQFCSVCFRIKDDYEQHLKTHNNDKPDSSIGSNGSFSESCLLPTLGSGDQKKTFTCRYCRKLFNFKASLINHLKTHKGGRMSAEELSIRCTICSKSFMGRIRMANHLRLHANQSKKQNKGAHILSGSSRDPEKATNRSVLPQNDSSVPIPSQEELEDFVQELECTGLDDVAIVKCNDDFDHRAKLTSDAARKSLAHYSHNAEDRRVCGSSSVNVSQAQHRIDQPINYSSARLQDRFGVGNFELSIKSEDERDEGSDVLSFSSSTGGTSKPYACSECGKRFKCESNLKIHMLTFTHSDEEVASVQQGNTPTKHLLKQSGTENEPNESIRVASSLHELDDFDFRRNLLEFSLTQDNKRSKALPTKNENPEFDAKNSKCCPVCNRRFSARPAMLQHMNLHSGEKPYRCGQCNECFMSRSSRHYHVNKVHGTSRLHNDRPFACLLCTNRYAAGESLQNHLRSSHANDAVLRPEQCHVCSKRFKSKYGLEAHLKCKCDGGKRSEIEALYKSLIESAGANKLFAQTFGVDVCSDNNSVKKMYHCSHCGKSFKLRSARYEHLLLVHPDVNPYPDDALAVEDKQQYKCQHCSRQFGSKLSLDGHRNKVHGKRSVFNSKSNFVGHMNKSCSVKPLLTSRSPIKFTGDTQSKKPFACLLCTQSYANENSLETHLLTHANDDVVRPYPCLNCGRRFKLKKGLDFHMKYQNFYCGEEHHSEILEVYKSLAETFGERKKSAYDSDMHHGDIVSIEKSFTCSHCEECFILKSALDEHVLLVHPGISPNPGGASFDEVDLTLDEKELWECSICNRFFKSKTGLYNHSKVHGSRTDYKILQPYNCLLCSTRYKTESGLKNHLPKHIKDLQKPNVCPQCCRRFLTLSRLIVHSRSCDCDEKERSEIKGIYESLTEVAATNAQQATNSSELVDENNVIEKPYRCKHCEESFSFRSTLRSHGLLMHPDVNPNTDDTVVEQEDAVKEKQPIKCYVGLCTKIFETKRSMTCHMATVHRSGKNYIIHKKRRKYPQPPYVCRICIKRFTFEIDLENHLLTHASDADERPHSCHLCERRFKVQRTLETHILSHNSAVEVPCGRRNNRVRRKHVCLICTKRFKFEVSLAKHLALSHANDAVERPHACNLCERRFKFEWAFDIHKKLHEQNNDPGEAGSSLTNSAGGGESSRQESNSDRHYPYVCSICTMRFTREEILTDHLKKHESDAVLRPYSCLMCEGRFRSEWRLDKHLKTYKKCRDKLSIAEQTVENVSYSTAITEQNNQRPFEPEQPVDGCESIIQNLCVSDEMYKSDVGQDALINSAGGHVLKLQVPRFLAKPVDEIVHDVLVHCVSEGFPGRKIDSLLESDDFDASIEMQGTDIPVNSVITNENNIQESCVSNKLDCDNTFEEIVEGENDLVQKEKNGSNKSGTRSELSMEEHNASEMSMGGNDRIVQEPSIDETSASENNLCEKEPGGFIKLGAKIENSVETPYVSLSTTGGSDPIIEEPTVADKSKGGNGLGIHGSEVFEKPTSASGNDPSLEQLSAWKNPEFVNGLGIHDSEIFEKSANENNHSKQEPCVSKTARGNDPSVKEPRHGLGVCDFGVAEKPANDISHSRQEPCVSVKTTGGNDLSVEEPTVCDKSECENRLDILDSQVHVKSGSENIHSTREPYLFEKLAGANDPCVEEPSNCDKSEGGNELDIRDSAGSEKLATENNQDKQEPNLSDRNDPILEEPSNFDKPEGGNGLDIRDSAGSEKMGIENNQDRQEPNVPGENDRSVEEPSACDKPEVELGLGIRDSEVSEKLANENNLSRLQPNLSDETTGGNDPSVEEPSICDKPEDGNGLGIRDLGVSEANANDHNHSMQKPFASDKPVGVNDPIVEGHSVCDKPEGGNGLGIHESGVPEKSTCENKQESEAFGKSSALEVDSSEMVDENLHKCMFCNKIFSTKMSLKGHITKVHSEKPSRRARCPFVCSICGQGYTYEPSLRNHLKKHENEVRPYACNQCPKAFKVEWGLMHHLKTHNCGEQSSNTDQVTETTSKPMCGSEENAQASEAPYRRVLDDDKLFGCLFCSKVFSWHRALKGHVSKKHTDGAQKKPKRKRILPYICNSCGAGFRYESSLRRHSLTHNEAYDAIERPHVCNKCGRRYKGRRSLNDHLLAHAIEDQQNILKTLSNSATSDERLRFDCPHCQKQFLHKKNYDLHLLTHAKVNSSVGEPVVNNSNLIEQSLEDRHEDFPFRCEHCGKRFKYEKSLNYHSVKHEKPSDVRKLDNSNVKTTRDLQTTKADASKKIKVSTNSAGDIASLSHLLQPATAFAPEATAVEMSTNSVTNAKPPLKPYRCSMCGRRFTDKWALKRHELIHTSQKPYGCMVCGEHFSRASELNKHTFLKHSKDSVITCPVCNESFMEARQFNLHVRKHEQFSEVDIPIKTESVSDVEEYSDSIPKASVQSQLSTSHTTNFPCEHCNKKFTTKQSLDKHSVLHIKIKPFKCDKCDLSFSLKGNQRRHTIEVHGQKLNFSCPYCKKSFKQVKLFNQHVRMHNIPNNVDGSSSLESMSCPCCNKHFQKRKAFATHLLKHSGETSISTKISAKTVRLNKEVKVNASLADLPFSCRYCNKQFDRKSMLNPHIENTHHALKPFPCPICGKKFGRRAHQIRHFDIAHGKTSVFSCPHCSKVLNDIKLFNLHLLTHSIDNSGKAMQSTGEKLPNECLYCKKRFKYEKNLKWHILYYCEKISSSNNSSSKVAKGNGGNSTSVERSVGKAPKRSARKSFVVDEPAAKAPKIVRKSPEIKRTINKVSKTINRKSSDGRSDENVNKGENLVSQIESANLSPHCQYCGKKCKNNNVLKVHLRKHTGERPYPCQHCGKMFSQISSRNLHVRKVHKQTERCPHCPKLFDNREVLKRHLQNFHPVAKDTLKQPLDFAAKAPVEKAFCCPHCNKTFQHKKRFDSHLLTHEEDSLMEPTGSSTGAVTDTVSLPTPRRDDDDFEKSDKIPAKAGPTCTICQKRFKYNKSLAFHLLKHNNEAAEKAIDSRTPSSSVHDLLRFENSNVGGRLHGLQQSNVSSDKSRDSVLRLGLDETSEEVPFGCPQCSKRFKFESSLTAHLKKHSRQDASSAQQSSRQASEFFVEKSSAGPTELTDGSIYLECKNESETSAQISDGYCDDAEDPLYLLPTQEDGIDQFD